MDPIKLLIANTEHLPILLDMMEDFNRIEKIQWNRTQGKKPLQKLLSDKNLGIVAIFLQQNSPIGYSVLTYGYDLEWSGKNAFITEFYLIPEARGKGWGQPCFRKIEEIAKKNKTYAIHLMVRPENKVAYEIYKKAGYKPTTRLFLTKDCR